MKKVIIGIVLLSLLALLSAGAFADDGMDGLCCGAAEIWCYNVCGGSFSIDTCNTDGTNSFTCSNMVSCGGSIDYPKNVHGYCSPCDLL